VLIPIWGPDRIGVRLSPLGKLNDISDADPEATFGGAAERLSEYGLAYLHIVNPRWSRCRRARSLTRARCAWSI
jgi:N-ethylmaleimide reductase